MAIHLSTPVSGLPGIGEKVAKDFKNMGIISVRDLLWYVPFRYDDFSTIKSISDLKSGDTVTINATVQSIYVRPTRVRHLKLVESIIEDDTGEIKVSWFNQPYLVQMLSVGTRASFSGTVENRNGLCITNPVFERSPKHIHTGRIVPVYGLTGSITMRRLRDAMIVALTASDELDDWLPKEIRKHEKFLSLKEAICSIHFPETSIELNRAIERLKFDELFLHQLLFHEIRSDRKKKIAHTFSVDETDLKKFVSSLPFQLTKSQKIAAWEIIKDLTKSEPMNRLLEGDVGSGKTVVAVIAAQHVISNSGTVAYLAPTELLAMQQFQSFKKFLPKNTIALLTHNQIFINEDECRRKEVTDLLREKKIDCVIGTHALLQNEIDFRHLSFFIVDEQHRFGVEQRHALLQQDDTHSPHLLSMSATPIPRSLALTLYGDLDLSILTELPKGRKPIGTALVPKEHWDAMWSHVRSEIESGRQVFVVCPLIDPSDKTGSRSVMEIETMLKKGPLKGLYIDVLHGKLKPEEKQKRNEEFRNGKIDVLVATTVVEVGVDVPNATVMVIFGAERFGLAQLHQLRGRVGRSTHESFCYLISDHSSQKTKERLSAVVRSQNGFELAEKDLELRGAGNVFGNVQSGFPDFQFATVADVDLMKKARDWSDKLLNTNDFFDTHPAAWERVRKTLESVHLE